MSTKKRGPNFTIPAFGGGPLQIFWPSITEAQTNLPNVLAKMLWSFLSGGPQAWGPPPLSTQTPLGYATGDGVMEYTLIDQNPKFFFAHVLKKDVLLLCA
jgi:hypothetical protein